MLLQSRQLLTSLLFSLQLFTIHLFAQSPVDKTVVLHVGNVTYTGYEIEKNLAIFKDTLRQKTGHAPAAADIDRWIQSFINRAYMLADAWDKRYDTLPEVNRWVAAMERFIISQPGGLLDEKLGGELTEQELNDAIQKHLRKLHYRYIKFPDHAAAFTILEGNATVSSGAAFEDLIKRKSAVQGMSTGQDIVQWPFFNRGVREELILDLKEGEISSLITLSDGVYLAQATSIEVLDRAALPPNFKQMITAVLKQRKTEQVHRRFYEESIQYAAIKYDETFLAALKEYLAVNGRISSFEKDMFPAIRKRTAMTYQVGGSTRQISADDWMNYFNRLPMKQAIRKENLVSNLEAFVVEDHAYEKAQETGITKDPKFILDRSNYKKNIVAVVYEREELKKGITVNDAEIAERYQRSKNEYNQATDAVITALAFPDRRGASLGYMAMRSGKADSVIKANAIETHRSIKYNEEIFTDSIRNAIFSMKVHASPTPIYYKGNWLLIIKESESGNRTRDLQEVKAIIARQIEEEKLEQKKQLLAEALKKKYPIQNEIDLTKYYVENQ